MGFEIGTVMLVQEDFYAPGRHFVNVIGNIPATYEHISSCKKRGQIDPVVKLLKRVGTPFTYDQEFYIKHGAGELWEEQAPFGYKTGIAVALHLPERRHLVVGFDRQRRLPSNDKSKARLLADLNLAAVFSESAANRLLGPNATRDTSVLLTKREVEVLQWTRAGKTAWEVGMLLQVAERTAVHHICTAMRKLDCTSKHQAVLKALSLGLLR